VRQRPMAADKFAAAALRGVARNRRVIVVPRSAGLLWRMSVLSPGAVDRITRSLARTVDRRLAAASGASD